MDSWLIVLCWEMEAGVCYCALLLMSSYVVFFLPCVHAYTHTHTHTRTVWGGKTFYVQRIIQCAMFRIQISLAQYGVSKVYSCSFSLLFYSPFHHCRHSYLGPILNNMAMNILICAF